MGRRGDACRCVPRQPVNDAERERQAVELELACLRAYIHANRRWLSPAEFKRYKRLEEREREYAIHDAIINRRNEP